jgi:hypothetical protein
MARVSLHPMQSSIKSILNGVVVIVVVQWYLRMRVTSPWEKRLNRGIFRRDIRKDGGHLSDWKLLLYCVSSV